MVNEIKLNYNTFGDATIYKVKYQSNYFNKGEKCSKDVDVLLNCYNWQLNKWEKIQLMFKGVKSIRFVETAQRPSTVVFEALMIDKEDVIFDFFPIQVDGRGNLQEDPKSDFSIHCKSVDYKVL